MLGVLIALSLESAWQTRTDRLAERALLVGLRDEFEENAGALGRWLELHEDIAAATREFIRLVEDAAEGQSVAVPDSLIGELGRTPTFDPELNSLDAALSSGQISLIRSADVQRALASWTRLLADAQEEEQRGAEQAYREFLPLLGEAATLGPAISWLITDVRSVMRGSADRSRPTTVSMVTADRRLTNALWVRYRLTASAANELEILQTGLGDVLRLLGQELEQ